MVQFQGRATPLQESEASVDTKAYPDRSRRLSYICTSLPNLLKSSLKWVLTKLNYFFFPFKMCTFPYWGGGRYWGRCKPAQHTRCAPQDSFSEPWRVLRATGGQILCSNTLLCGHALFLTARSSGSRNGFVVVVVIVVVVVLLLLVLLVVGTLRSHEFF